MRTPTRHEVERSVQPSGSRPTRTSREGIAPATSKETEGIVRVGVGVGARLWLRLRLRLGFGDDSGEG